MTRPNFVRVGDHAPELVRPSGEQVKTALTWSRDEILIASIDLKDAIDNLIEAFIDGRHAEINQAASVVQKHARQIDGLTASLIRGCCDQMKARRVRS